MNLESVKLELEINEINIVQSDSEYYWDDDSIVFEYNDEHILVYVSEDDLTYFLYTLQLQDEWEVEEGEEPELINCTSHFGNVSSVEGMLSDLGIK